MAFSRYGRRYRRYRKYRRFYRRYRRGYSRKFINASSRSSVRMKTAVTHHLKATAGYGDAATGAVVSYVIPFASTASTSMSAANSPLYRTYCNLYEECKMIGAKIQLSVVSAVGGSDIPSLQIYTAWDRKHGSGEADYTVQNIKDSSTSCVATALNNNVAKLTRACYASDLIEKATWFDATLDTAANGYRNKAWHAAGENPNMFCPALYFFFNCPSLGIAKEVDVSISITYYFAFRNPRFGGSAGSAKLVDLGARSVFEPEDDDDGDMEDGDVPDLPPQTAAELAELADDSAPAPIQRRQASLGVQQKKRSRVVVVDPKN